MTVTVSLDMAPIYQVLESEYLPQPVEPVHAAVVKDEGPPKVKLP